MSQPSIDPKIKTLMRKLAEATWDGGGVDGADLEDWLIEAKVLRSVIVHEPCAEGGACRCREYFSGPPWTPWTCYRLDKEFA